MNALESDFGLQLTGADIARLEQPGSVRLRKLLVKDVS
jgi:general secretion pathway protein M